MPGLLCAAHALIVARTEPRGVDDYVHAGRAVQRFWLTATSLGIMMQPETTPLIFASYAEHGVAFSKLPGATEAAERIGVRLRRIFGEMPVQRSVFMCRLGHGRKPKARSLRRSVEALLLQQSPERR
jgi:hypothetical protein